MNKEQFMVLIEPMFRRGKISPPQLKRINILLQHLIQKDVYLSKAAYILATAFHETDQFRAMKEYASGAAYEGRTDLGNTIKGDGKRFKGRGFVGITGRRNYSLWVKRLGVDVVGNPNLLAEPKYAARVITQGMLEGLFTGRSLGDYINHKKRDYYNARRVVNGLNKANLIANYAIHFQEVLTKVGYPGPPGYASPQVATETLKAKPQPPISPIRKESFLLQLWKWLITLFQKLRKSKK